MVQTVRPYTAADLGRRVRVLWQGAEYRGRGRETNWQGKLTLTGNRIARFAPVNFLNPERQVREIKPGTALAWNSVTTGNLAGIDLWLETPRSGVLDLETNIVSGRVDLAALTGDAMTFDGGGLDRRLSVYRLPEADWSRRVACEHPVSTPAPPTCRSICASRRPTVTRPGRARSTSLHDFNTRFWELSLPRVALVGGCADRHRAVLCRSDALAVVPFGAVKSPIESGDIALVRTSADFQLPAYAIYKPIQAVSDPALEYLENSILHIASSLEEAQQAVSP